MRLPTGSGRFVIGFFTVVGLLVGAASAHATLLFTFPFNQDGVLPSTSPYVDYFSYTGLPEAATYSVSGGLLHQRTFGLVGSADYAIGGLLLGPHNGRGTLAGISPGLSAELEARLRILRISGNPDPVMLEWIDGVDRYSLDLVGTDPTDVVVRLRTPAGQVVAATLNASQFHTFRLFSPPNSSQVRLFIDGALAFVTSAQPFAGLNRIVWGDNNSSTGVGADVDWDFVRFSQPVRISEPGTWLLAIVGLAGVALSAMRSRRRISRRG